MGGHMDSEQLLKDLLTVPREAGLNRLRWISTHMDEEQQIDFLKGLLAKSVESRETQNGEVIFDYIDNWEEMSMAAYAMRTKAPFEVEDAPWAPLRVPIRQAKIALITTGGFYVTGQEPYETDGPENQGDWSFRPIPRTTAPQNMEVTHLHYDLTGPRKDRNCVFPIDRAEEMAAEGLIGSLADTYYSFMGFIQRPDLLAQDTAPQVARLLKADGVDAVVLTAT